MAGDLADAGIGAALRRGWEARAREPRAAAARFDRERRRVVVELTIDALWGAIGRILDLVSPSECENMFAAAGYDPDWCD